MSKQNGKEVLVQIRDLKKHFPIRRGVIRRQVGAVQAVDGLNFDIYKGEILLWIHLFRQFRKIGNI